MLFCTTVPKLHVPAAELWKELVLDVHVRTKRRTFHLDKLGGGACKCGVGSLVHRRKLLLLLLLLLLLYLLILSRKPNRQSVYSKGAY